MHYFCTLVVVMAYLVNRVIPTFEKLHRNIIVADSILKFVWFRRLIVFVVQSYRLRRQNELNHFLYKFLFSILSYYALNLMYSHIKKMLKTTINSIEI